jgi:hypothetical protein
MSAFIESVDCSTGSPVRSPRRDDCARSQPKRKAHRRKMIPTVEGDKVIAERFRTKLCRNYLQHPDRPCPSEERCMFAHGDHELRTAAQNVADGLMSEEAIRVFKENQKPFRRRRSATRRFAAKPLLNCGSHRIDPLAEQAPKPSSLEEPLEDCYQLPPQASSLADHRRESPTKSTPAVANLNLPGAIALTHLLALPLQSDRFLQRMHLHPSRNVGLSQEEHRPLPTGQCTSTSNPSGNSGESPDPLRRTPLPLRSGHDRSVLRGEEDKYRHNPYRWRAI